MEYIRNFAGTQNWRIFRIVPPYIDRTQVPGYSTLPSPSMADWFYNALILKHMWASPNLVWFLLSLAFYFVFPYDLSPSSAAAAGPFSWPFFCERFPLWFCVTFGYVGFWHVTLYWLNFAERPFVSDRVYNWDKVLHNAFYTLTGVLIWVGFENVFAFIWATGRLQYVTDQQAFGTFEGFARFFLGAVLMPPFRDLHFYFAHRFIHFKPMYHFVHSLHHRNTDTEPFSGLCMHAIEHFYYYTSFLPCIFFLTSPFLFLWTGVHLLITPAGSHSGFEDQWEPFHYIHHRYYEANYAGQGAAALDVMFGTFTEKFKDGPPAKARPDAKATLRSLPSTEDTVYLALSTTCIATWIHAALHPTSISTAHAVIVSILAAAGPVVVACILTAHSTGLASLIDPFGRQAPWKNALHLVAGSVLCILPIAVTCYIAL